MTQNVVKTSRNIFAILSNRPMTFVRAALAISTVFTAASCVGSADESQNDLGLDDEVSEESQALGVTSRLVGDSACPSGYSLATSAEAQANKTAICSKLGTWDITRLAGGGSMDGPGYGCGIRNVDTRGLGHSVCKKAVQFERGVGDNVCPSGFTTANPMVARANSAAMCAKLGTWDIARLAGGGSMDGPGYGCTIRDSDTRGLGHTACAQLDFMRAVGDKPCPAGSALISPQEARARQAELCSKLGTWDIARLDGGGSMDGSGYGCTIRDSDTRGLGHALCGVL